MWHMTFHYIPPDHPLTQKPSGITFSFCLNQSFPHTDLFRVAIKRTNQWFPDIDT